VDVSGEKAAQIPVCQTFEQMFQLFAEICPDALVANEVGKGVLSRWGSS